MTSGAAPPDWQRVEEIFRRVLEAGPEERQAKLEEECGEDDALRQEVKELLAADAEAGDFIEEAVAGGGELLGARDDPLAGQRVLGKYEVLERIGEGGFGAVYRGKDTVLGRYIAIKVCTSRNEDLRRRFFREAEIAAGLQHPNVTTLHDLGTAGGVPFLVQEFLEGEDLDEVIGRREALPAERRLDVLLQIARGLEHAHRKGVLHRDVKPANVRLLPSGRAKLMDFGIARLLDDDTGLTQEGQSLGTAGYFAPELLRGETLDPRADLFAFGVLAYELLTYEKPFPGETFSQISYRLLYEKPIPLNQHWPACPPALDRLVERCLAKDREERYGDAGALIRDLEPLLEEGGLAADSPPEVRSQGLRRTAGPLAAVAVAAVALIFVLSPELPVPERPTAEDPGGAATAIGGNPLEANTSTEPLQLQNQGGSQGRGAPGAADAGNRDPEMGAPDGRGRGGESQGGDSRLSEMPGTSGGPSGRVPSEVPGTSGGTSDEASSRVPRSSGARSRAAGSESDQEVPRTPGGPSRDGPRAQISEVPGTSGAGSQEAATEVPGTSGAHSDETPSEVPGTSGAGQDEAPRGSAAERPGTSGADSTGGSGKALSEVPGTSGAQSGGLSSEVPGTSGVGSEAGSLPLPTEVPGTSGEASAEVPGTSGASGSGREAGEEGPGEKGVSPLTESAWPLLQAGPDIVVPELLQRPTPRYPEAARRRSREATIVVGVLVDGEGRVEHAIVKQGDPSGYGLNEAALEAAREARFRPARSEPGGEVGKMWTEISFDFRLE